MGELLNRLKEQDKNIAENYKSNTMLFYEGYQKTSKEIMSIRVGQMQLGGFYFLQYQDDSNWMQYSPVFTVDFRKFDNLVVIYALNLNFIPLQVRATIFDRYITKKDLEGDTLLKTDYQAVYKVLLQYGYEYALVEYNMKQIQQVHKIKNSLIPQFLYSGFPKNKYDPKKLYSIWKKKINDRDKRHNEMMNSVIDDFYNLEKDISNDYDALEKHIERVRKSYEKYGK
jgi:hypothetical protein